MKNIKNNYKRGFFNDIPKMLYKKIINNLIIKASSDLRIIDPAILNILPEGNYEPIFAYDQSVIIFGTTNNIIVFSNTGDMN